MVDDKTSIGIGPIDTPVEATRRQKPVLQISNQPNGLQACDHDHTPQSITPSVTLRVKPVGENINWYNGQVYVSYKCAIFNPSSAMSHAAEMSEHHLDEAESRPFLYVLSDGGPDHKTTNVSTHMSFIALFLLHNLDGIIAARTPPYLSVLNPCERVMPTINYALYGLSLAQTHLEDSEQKLIKNLFSKDAWRKAQAEEAHKPQKNRIDYETLAAKSLAGARDILTKRTEQMVFGGNNIQVLDPTPKSACERLTDTLKKFFPSHDFEKKVSKADFLKNEAIKEFYKSHVHEMTYVLQIKKCKNENCEYHLPIRSEMTTMDKYVWLPPPTTSESNKDKYEDFSVLIEKNGLTMPKETCRPSSKADVKDSSGLQKPSFPYINSKARACIRCGECGKGRLLYSNIALSREDIIVLTELKESFVCGLDIFIGTTLHNILVQHHTNSCNKNMTAAYFSSGPKCLNYLKICSVCAEIDEYCVENPKYQGLPRCSNCQSENKYYRHKHPIFKRK